MDSTQSIGTGNEDEEAAKKKNILDWINHFTSIDYSSQQSRISSRRTERTGQWFLESAEFRTWTEKNQQTMFCPGIPGAGKTFITSMVVDELVSTSRSNKNIGVAYIYFDFRRQNEQTPAHVLLSLLEQLSRRLPSLPPVVEFLYYHHKHEETIPPSDELSEALQSVGSMYERVFFVIDALDECVPDSWSLLLKLICEVQTKTRANLFATSRNIPKIAKMFQSSILLTIRATDDDIRTYLDSRIKLPAVIRLGSDLVEDIKTEIIKSADGMYEASTFSSLKADHS